MLEKVYMRSLGSFKHVILGGSQKRGIPEKISSYAQKRAARGVDQAFPEALKEPVLRKLQFSTISRLDHLVEYIYDVLSQYSILIIAI